MSHKEKAVKFLVDALSDQTSKSPAGYDAATMMISHAQAHATLALVEAQERANEQARIANLIALGVAPGVSFEVNEQVISALTQDAGNDVYPLAPEIARALGIGGAE